MDVDNLKRPYNIFFFSSLLFAIGVIFASFNLNFLILAAALSASAIIFYLFNFNLKILLFLIIFLPAGAFYYFIYDIYQSQNFIPYNQRITFTGVVVSDPKSEIDKQKFYFKLDAPYRGKILIETSLYPLRQYGDFLKVEGKIKPTKDNYYSDYIKTYNIKLLSENNGNFILSHLFKVKHLHLTALKQLLNFNQSALLAGILFGETGELSKKILNKLSLSGLRHLISLSGFHMTVIVMAISNSFRYLLSSKKNLAFILTLFSVLAFILMTGLLPPAVRAAFMAGILALANFSERKYLARNAIMAAGFILILFNPKIAVFDISFQLSFLAIIGIIYLTPVLIKFSKINLKANNFLWWKESLAMTIAAQLTTAPILISQFSNFTLTSFMANLVVLPTVPALMGLGFTASLVYYIFHPAAMIISWITAALLDYQIFIINLTSKFALSFNPHLSWWLIAGYYGFILTTCFYVQHKQKLSLLYGFYTADF